jgi:hypothetical protein
LHKAFALQISQNLAAIFLRCTAFAPVNATVKSCDALPALVATIVLPDFARSLFADSKKVLACRPLQLIL